MTPAEEQAALRRVAELVARGADRQAVLEAIVGEAFTLFPVDFTALLQYEPDGAALIAAVHEGPPGLVNGGFLAVFFDCITQHQSCAARRTGKTRSLTVTFRRPTPVLTELHFDIERSEDESRVTSTARLLLDDEVLCIGEFKTVASPPDKLTGFQFGERRVKN